VIEQCADDVPLDGQWEEWECEEDPRVEAADQKVVEGFKGWQDALGPWGAWHRLEELVKVARPSGPEPGVRQRGRPRTREPFSELSARDTAILAEYDRAPGRGNGRDLTGVYSVHPVARTEHQKDARRQHLKRLVRQRLKQQALRQSMGDFFRQHQERAIATIDADL
jgi:hypothetical protein